MAPDYVIVTLRTQSGSFEADYELPAKLPVECFIGLLLKSLAQRAPMQFGLWKGVSLSCGDRILSGGDTLEGCLIWDGQILIIREV